MRGSLRLSVPVEHCLRGRATVQNSRPRSDERGLPDVRRAGGGWCGISVRCGGISPVRMRTSSACRTGSSSDPSKARPPRGPRLSLPPATGGPATPVQKPPDGVLLRHGANRWSALRSWRSWQPKGCCASAQTSGRSSSPIRGWPWTPSVARRRSAPVSVAVRWALARRPLRRCRSRASAGPLRTARRRRRTRCPVAPGEHRVPSSAFRCLPSSCALAGGEEEFAMHCMKRSRAKYICGPPKPRFSPVGVLLVRTTRLWISRCAIRYGPVMCPWVR